MFKPRVALLRGTRAECCKVGVKNGRGQVLDHLLVNHAGVKLLGEDNGVLAERLNGLPEADKQLMNEVLWEASSRASKDILDAETSLVAEFEKRGKTVNKVDRAPFAAAVKAPMTAADAPWSRDLYDRMQAIK